MALNNSNRTGRQRRRQHSSAGGRSHKRDSVFAVTHTAFGVILAAMLSFVLVVGAVPATAWADTSQDDPGGETGIATQLTDAVDGDGATSEDQATQGGDVPNTDTLDPVLPAPDSGAGVGTGTAGTGATDSSDVPDAVQSDAPQASVETLLAPEISPLAYTLPAPNPQLPQKCGIRFSLVLDNSGSIGSAGMNNLKLAANAFIDALAGTGSSVTISSFATTGTVRLANATTITSANAATIKASYASLTSTAWTNWQDGLLKAQSTFASFDGGRPDLVVMITDGNPNTYNTGSGVNTVSDGADAAVNPAIALANAFKGQGIHLFGIAVGSGITLPPIQAVTSTVAFTGSNFRDAGYMTTTNYSTLSATLQEIALALCGGTVTLHKQIRAADNSLSDGQGWVFNATSTGAIAPATSTTGSNGNTDNFTVTGFANPNATRSATFTETPQPGYTLEQQNGSNAVCTKTAGDGTITVTNTANGFTVNGLRSNSIVSCEVINRVDQATLTLVKALDTQYGGTNSASDWTLFACDTAFATGQTKQVNPGTYILTESQIAGWQLSGIACVNSGGATVALTGGNSLVLGAGDNVTCTFTNSDRPGTFTWKKVDNSAPPVNLAGATFRLQSPNGYNQLIEDNGDLDSDPAVGQFRVTGLAWGTYTLTEVTPPPGYVAGAPVTRTVDGDTVMQDIALGNIVNVPNPVQPTIDKRNASATQNPDGTWTITYLIDVTQPASGPSNPAGIGASYTLTDTLSFGAGIVINSASWAGETSGDWTPSAPVTNPLATLATDRAIAQGATHTYTVTVAATVTAAAWSDGTTVCKPGSKPAAGGFLNQATVSTGPGYTMTDYACDAPSKLSVTKSLVGAPTFDSATGNWTVNYSVVVTNESSDPLYYDLSDTLGFSAGVVVVTASAIGPSGPILGWTGSAPETILATGVGISPAGMSNPATHTYTITAIADVSGLTGNSNTNCTGHGDRGFLNSATLITGTVPITDTACTPIPSPKLSHSKTVVPGSITQAADGTWRIQYTVTVRNTGAAGTYSLTDETRFGTGITYPDSSASATGPGSVSIAGWTGRPGNAELAANAPIAAGTPGTPTMHTYTLTVEQITIPDAAFDPGSAVGKCPKKGGDSVGALNNASYLTVRGATSTSAACALPTVPTIAKEFVSATQDPAQPQSWTVVYDIVVDNSTGTNANVVDVIDTPEFASGVSIGTVVVDGGTSTAWTGPSLTVADDATILAGDTVRYTLAFTVTVSTEVDPDDRECAPSGSGSGFFNSAYLTSGGYTSDPADSCAPIDEEVVPSVTKQVSGIVQLESGSWQVSYTLAVEQPTKDDDAEFPVNPKGLSGSYDLSDELAFGGDIDIVSRTATNDVGIDTSSWTGAGLFRTLASGQVIVAGATHTFTIVVVADLLPVDDGVERTVCERGEETSSGGFLNTAVLTTAGGDTPVEACADATVPTVSKYLKTVQRNEDGNFDIEYLLRVSNPADPETTPTPPSARFVLTDELSSIPAGLSLVGTPRATAVGVAPAPINAERPADGGWLIAEGTIAPGVAYEYLITLTVQPNPGAVGIDPGICDDASGLVVSNTGVVSSGALAESDDACAVINFDDLGIVKTHTTIPADGVDDGTEYSYTLTVTNHGTRAVDHVVVEDLIPDRLQVTGVDVPSGWSDDSAGNSIVVNSGWQILGVGESVTVTVHVTVLPPVTEVIPPVTSPEAPPAPESPLAELVNEACVSFGTRSGGADLRYGYEPDFVDIRAANDCDDDTVPLKGVTGNIWYQCVADVAYLHYSVRTTPGLSDQPITLRWVPDTVNEDTQPAEIALTLSDGETGSMIWPGAAATPSGVSIDWPGWRPLAESDYGVDGQLLPSIDPANVWNGWILDANTPDYVWRLGSTITLSVNPEASYEVSYPDASPDCAVTRTAELTIQKEASVVASAPGGSFDYTLTVTNNDLGSASPVTVSDPIPASLRVTGVETSTTAFPRWQNCAVTGASPAGYGGTLTCELFGPLLYGESAPPLVVQVSVDRDTAVTVIDNVATVSWADFDDPGVTGSHSDSATVVLIPLADTGGMIPLANTGGMIPLADTGNNGQIIIVWVAFVALLTGAMVILWSQRRRADKADLPPTS